MLNKLGMFLLEDSEGKISIQLFKDIDNGKDLFDNFKGDFKEIQSRATYLSIDFEGNNVKMETKELPILSANSDDWGYRLGDGPIKKPSDIE